MKETKNLTQGNVLSTLLQFAIPVLLAMFLQALYGGIDLLIVGQFGTTQDVSGVSTGSMLLHTLTSLIVGLTMGITVFVGQKIGEGKPEEAGKSIGSGIVLFSLLGILFSILTIIFTKPLARILHAPEEAFTQTCQYIQVCGAGLVFIVFYNLLGAIFRGIGDSKTPLLTVFIACIVNIFADLIFVALFKMGAFGAALATVLAQALSVLVSLAIIIKRGKKTKLPFEFHKSYIKLDGYYCKQQIKIGTPIALQDFLVGISFLVIQTVVNSLGLIASAGVGVAEKVCGFIMLIPSAISQSLSAFVAQNIGAGLEKRAKLSLKCGIAISLAMACFIGTFSFFRGDILAGIFSKDVAVIASGHIYLKAYAIDTFLTSFLFCFIGYFNGMGKTFFTMIQGLVGGIAIRIPMVFIMKNLPNTNLFLIGLSTPIATFCQILMCFAYYFMLRKKTKLKAI
ncbi:MAG: MATE family efflux transporter [Spirochaetaceae bacterium]|nr:MATE family efflux transporter [Spirochaetaceae bacterium]